MKFRISLLLTLLGLLLMGSCHRNDDPLPEPVEKETSILLYGVASNNLSYYFQQDLSEIKEGLKKCDLSKVDFYVYCITKTGDAIPTLSRAVLNNEGEVDFTVVKEYDRELASTDPERITAVIDDYRNLSTAPANGLIMWSHATAWAPAPVSSRMAGYQEKNPSSVMSEYDESRDRSSGEIGDLSEYHPVISQWWGQDIDNGTYNYCNLGDFAYALPDGYFDFIWFDCCYMSSVEVIYELRNKADYFVAYPTEVNAEGAPYQIVAPFIARPNPDLIGASEEMSKYYLSGKKTFTIAVIDPKVIEEVAHYSSMVANEQPASSHELLIYSRAGLYFYDFAQFIKSKAASSESDWNAEAFDKAMDKLILYKNCSSQLFTGMPLDKSNYSGISSAYIVNSDMVDVSSDADMHFYQTLDWYKRVYLPWEQ